MRRHRPCGWRLTFPGVILALTLVVIQDNARAAERILSFDSDIDVHQNGTMTVTETIRVKSERNRIKRGIFRDFPTHYKTRNGQNYVVDFELIRVERDGKSEPHHIKSLSNGVRIYFGQENIQLSQGEYAYRLTYQTNRQLGFFDSHDELYWNVTGNDWAFPIDQATARITLPPVVPGSQVSVEAYTGVTGSQGQDHQATVDSSGQSSVTTTRSLRPSEGLTIVVTWPKGYVAEPSMQDKAGYFLRDNRVTVIGLIGLGALLSYYLMVWLKVGRDPDRGTIVPLFHPPGGLSPAAIRYVYRMGFDNKAYAAAIINMAVKGYLLIEDDDDTYRVLRVDSAKDSVLSPGEKKVARSLFAGKKSATFERKYNASIRKSIKVLKSLLKREYHSTQFKTNRWYLVPGVILSVLILVISGFSYSGETGATLMMMSVWLTGWSFGVFMLIRQRQMLMAVVFIFFEIAAVSMLFELGSWGFLILLAVLITLNIVFYYLIKAPTDVGRKLMDKIEGFRLYLATAEEDRLNTLNPPEQTPELFEKYLPYALALGVDQAWSERFARTLDRSLQEDSQAGYHPKWYRGSRWNDFNPASFSSDLGSSLSKAVASSSVAPGSGSGSGGGGSSGGGGGGGGGGGW